MRASLAAGLLAAAVLVTGCGKSYKLTYCVSFPSAHAQTRLATEWADEIGKRTNGKVRITVLASDSRADLCYQNVVAGVSDIGMGAFASTPERFPLLTELDLPVGYPDGLSATRIANALYVKYQPAECKDVKMLYLHAHGPSVLASRLPIVCLASLKGLKVGSAGFNAKVIESLGGSPVSLPQNEILAAFQKGAMDAAFCPIATLKGEKLGEVVNCMTDAKCVGCTTAFFVAMNPAKWAALPADIQKTIEIVSAEWMVKHGQAWNRADGEGFAYLKGLKRDVLPLSATEEALWVSKAAPLLRESAASADRKGVPGTAFLNDLQAAVAETRRTQKGLR